MRPIAASLIASAVLALFATSANGAAVYKVHIPMPPRMLYMKCNMTARKIASRWLTYLKRRQQAHVVAAWPYLESACRQLLDRGISPNMREIEPLVPADILNRVCNCWDVLREVRAHIESSEYATAALCSHRYPQRWVQE